MEQGVCLMDAELRFVFCNRRVVELQGLPAGRFGPGDRFEDFLRYQIERGEYGEGGGEQHIADRLELIRRGGVHTLERRRPDGTVLDIRRAPLPDGGFLTTYTDVTHTRRVERDLEANEERQALILEAVAEGIYDWDIVRNRLYCSPRLDEMANFDWGEHGPRSEAWVARVHPDDRTGYQAALVAYFKGRSERLDCEYRLADRDGNYRWLRDHAKCVRDAGGRAVRLMGAVTDIDQHKATEEALRASDTRYALALEAIEEAVFDWNIDADEIYYSPAAYTLLGAEPDALRSPQDWPKRIHPDDRAGFRDAVVSLLKGETEHFYHEHRYRAADGSWRWAKLHGVALRDETGHAYRMIGATGDITERKQLEQALDETRARLTEAIDSIDEGFVIFGANDEIVLCNSVFPRYFTGMEDRVVPGARFADLIRAAAERGLFPDALGRVDEWMARVLERRGRTTGPREQHLAGDRWLQITDHRTSDGGLVAVYTDITELKRQGREIAEARDQALEANRTKSQFLANMSHELRTPMNAIIGLTEMLQEDAEDDGLTDYLEPLQRIERAGKHLLELINEVLDLSKIEAGKIELHLEEFELRTLLGEILTTAQPLAERNRNRLDLSCSDDLGPLWADITRVRQIVFNLVSNACKFTEDGSVSIDASRRDDGGRVRIAVCDTGIGITDEQMGRLFQEFSQADSSTTRKTGASVLARGHS